ncbi:MAG: formate dehydrogenase major subunit, partial [Cryomorphaceae bacterium]
PHVKAEHHLKLLPGTNVAFINALSHVIVREKLYDEDFVKTRCEEQPFAEWLEFISDDRHSPENTESITGIPAKDLAAAAELFATGGNGAIYYGLGVTEHSQGSTTVMGIANLAMLTGNIGRPGVGVNPLRGQNNVQGSCDMGSFPHELPGYRPVSDDATRGEFEKAWNVELDGEPGLRINNMLDAAVAGQYKGLYCQGEDIAQSDPNTKHVEEALRNLECLIVQDLFLNETAKFATVFLPGSSFLEKNGTFTNAERRISPVRQVMPPLAGLQDWEVTMGLCNALGFEMNYEHPREIMQEIAALTPTFANVTYERIDKEGSLQWPCNDDSPDGTPTMHIDEFVRGKGLFKITEYVATDEKVTRRFPLLLTTGRILSQYNVGAQTRRTENNVWHSQDILEIHPSDAEDRGIVDGDRVEVQSRSGTTHLTATVTERVQPSVIYTTFHHPESGANVITTDNSDWATNCPEYKVTAVQIKKVIEARNSEWQKQYVEFSDKQVQLADLEQ